MDKASECDADGAFDVPIAHLHVDIIVFGVEAVHLCDGTHEPVTYPVGNGQTSINVQTYVTVGSPPLIEGHFRIIFEIICLIPFIIDVVIIRVNMVEEAYHRHNDSIECQMLQGAPSYRYSRFQGYPDRL